MYALIVKKKKEKINKYLVVYLILAIFVVYLEWLTVQLLVLGAWLYEHPYCPFIFGRLS